jgi:single-strand DNA-binding protein
MLNNITIMGRLTRDPELRRTASGIAVASFCVAVDRDWPNKETGERETDFINCAAWRQTGEFVSKYFTKGSMIVVSGRLQIKKWTDHNGMNHYDAEIVADNVYFGESKRDKDANASTNTAPNYYNPYSSSDPAPSYANPYSAIPGFDDDDAVLPF